MNSKFSHLRMKHDVRHMSTCTESAHIYVLFEIIYNFFTHLCLQLHARFLPGVEESGVVCWRISWISRSRQEITKGKILMATPYRYARTSLVPEIFCGVIQPFYVKCGRSLHPAETRSCQSPIRPSLATTEWISCLGNVLYKQ